MAYDNRYLSKRQQIRNLLVVFGGGILCAFLIIGTVLFYYGPTGEYILKNILLAPDITKQLTFTSKDSKTGQVQRFSFDRIEFSFYNAAKKMKQNVKIDPRLYQEFYKMIENDKSLLDVPNQIETLFDKSAAMLTLYVHAEGSSEKKVFQQVHFSNNGDYYRIQLQDENAPKWIYYQHPHIYQNSINLFTSK